MEHCSMQHTLQQSHCLSKQSVTAVFQHHSERHDATRLLWVSKLHQERSVKNSKCPRSAHTPNKSV